MSGLLFNKKNRENRLSKILQRLKNIKNNDADLYQRYLLYVKEMQPYNHEINEAVFGSDLKECNIKMKMTSSTK
jgi:hypothetical protein